MRTCSKLLSHWVSSFESLTIHIGCIREYLKDSHAREEEHQRLHRIRTPLTVKAERLELKERTDDNWSPELSRLYDEISSLDTKITKEVPDFEDRKGRVSEWMCDLFGALLKCGEKGAVVTTLGLAIISTGTIQPGLPRAHSSGTGKYVVESRFAVEAERKVVVEQPPNEKGSTDADAINRLDSSGVGPSTCSFLSPSIPPLPPNPLTDDPSPPPVSHRDLSHDTLILSPNRLRTNPPAAARPDRAKQAVEEDPAVSKESSRPKVPEKKVGVITQIEHRMQAFPRIPFRLQMKSRTQSLPIKCKSHHLESVPPCFP